MEAIVRPLTWEEWPESAMKIFKVLCALLPVKKSSYRRISSSNAFYLLVSCVVSLTEEMAVYRRPYLEAGESRDVRC